MSESREPFISNEDRPKGYDLDTPIATLKVRDLASILARMGPNQKMIHPKLEGHGPLKEFFDKAFPEVLAPLGSLGPREGGIDGLVESFTGLAARVEELGARLDEINRRMDG